MSCHFHLLRNRKAAAAKNAENKPVEAVVETPKETITAKEKPAQKAAKGRRKGDS